MAELDRTGGTEGTDSVSTGTGAGGAGGGWARDAAVTGSEPCESAHLFNLNA